MRMIKITFYSIILSEVFHPARFFSTLINFPSDSSSFFSHQSLPPQTDLISIAQIEERRKKRKEEQRENKERFGRRGYWRIEEVKRVEVRVKKRRRRSYEQTRRVVSNWVRLEISIGHGFLEARCCWSWRGCRSVRGHSAFLRSILMVDGHVLYMVRDIAQEENVAVYNPRERYSLDKQRKLLPVYKRRRWLLRLASHHSLIFPSGWEFLYLLEKYEVVVVLGETGSGKSTRK